MNLETDSWSDYWQAGQKTTFGSLDDFRENAHLTKLWRTLLGQSLAGKFLDIGCGNGALSLLLIQLAEELSSKLDVHGIDSAKIWPPQVCQKPRIELKSNTSKVMLKSAEF